MSDEPQQSAWDRMFGDPYANANRAERRAADRAAARITRRNQRAYARRLKAEAASATGQTVDEMEVKK